MYNDNRVKEFFTDEKYEKFLTDIRLYYQTRIALLKRRKTILIINKKEHNTFMVNAPFLYELQITKGFFCHFLSNEISLL